MKTILLMFIATVLCASVACEDDAQKPIINGLSYKDLTARGNVLYNLELAYKNRQVSEYEKLLDENFVFYLAPGDVGGSIPPEWGRADEMTVHNGLLSRNHTGPGPQCLSIALDIKDDNVVWVEVPAGNETWYRTTLYHDFVFEMENDTYYRSLPESHAEFTVRNAGTDDAPRWQLVEMRDMGAERLLARGTESSTWGSVKALYR